MYCIPESLLEELTNPLLVVGKCAICGNRCSSGSLCHECRAIEKPILPGSRVRVFDYRLFKDDKSTPLSYTMREATVVARYSKKCYYPVSEMTYIYPDLLDVVFDHDDCMSKGHFTYAVEVL